KLRPGTILVLDDVHNADVPQFRAIVAVLLEELPQTVRCVCLSRAQPPQELRELALKGRLGIVDESVLRFSDREARAMLTMRLGRAAPAVSIAAACGWAAGLALLAARASAPSPRAEIATSADPLSAEAFAALAGQLIDSLPRPERDLLLKLSLLPEVRPEIVTALGGSAAAQSLLDALHR